MANLASTSDFSYRKLKMAHSITVVCVCVCVRASSFLCISNLIAMIAVSQFRDLRCIFTHVVVGTFHVRVRLLDFLTVLKRERQTDADYKAH